MPTSRRAFSTATRLSALVLVLVLVVGPAPTSAMDISIQRLPDGFHAVFANGFIVPGDTERLRVALQSADRDRWGNKDVALNSGGGSVTEALAMAELMDQEKVSTYVLAGGECASACAQIVFFSGIYREVFDGGRLGIHSGFCSRRVM
jgi:hypothetical protein